jgi:tetratricopeptide (TPR) repeat protein
MDDSFKNDIGLLVTECFIRAVEAHTLGNSKTPEAEREQLVQASEAQGFILTRYFYDSLTLFEKDAAGLRNVFGDMLAHIDVGREYKRAEGIKFAAQADPEVLRLARPAPSKLLQSAEQHLSDGDKEGAQKFAQQALDQKSGDSGRALFILAQVAAASSNMDGARNYFEQALAVAQEPRVVAWSHIYLGRIFDIEEDRDAAMGHYRAALTAGSTLPGVKDAAERGLQQPYEPPRPPQQ